MDYTREQPGFPKIFQVGTRNVKNIFESEVEITEKIDGSQIGFGNINDELYIRSKRKEVFVDNPDSMFRFAVEVIARLFQDKALPPNIVYYGEYLQKPKHNVLAYDSIPRNHIQLFGSHSLCDDLWFSPRMSPAISGDPFDDVPVLFKGKVNDFEQFNQFLETDSVLGGQKIEGFVIKNYNKQAMITENIISPIMCAKYVSEKFKEKHNNNWRKENTGKGQWETFCLQFRSEARFEKAVQHMRDDGNLTETPKDIGGLIKEIQNDITEEEREAIKDRLWTLHSKELMRIATAGFPEWYKQKLAETSFGDENETM